MAQGTYKQCFNIIKQILPPCQDDSLLGIALKKLEKLAYSGDENRWHDLRKNPDDLPKKEGWYHVCVLVKEKKEWGIKEHITYDTYPNVADRFKESSFTKVIAWREIEPFEEE